MDALGVHDQEDGDDGDDVQHRSTHVLRELDASIIAHWAQRLADDDGVVLAQCLNALGEDAFGIWLHALGFDREHIASCREAVDGCPWPADPGEPQAIVKRTFGGSFGGTISQFASQCVGVYRVFHYGHWFQIYVLSTAMGYRLVAGGPPNLTPFVSEEFASSSWEVPHLLQLFYRVHDGFGPLESASSFWFEDAILPAAALAPLTRYIHFGEDITYNPADCLMFSPDGGGNGYCFQRSSVTDRNPSLVFWGCQDRELSPGPDFLALLKQLTASE